jgi:hypothetical protein
MNRPAMQAVPMREEDFRLMVVQKLSRVETLLIELAGNGRPGRIQRLEDRVRAHDRLLWMSAGAGAVLGWLLRYALG